VWEAVRNKISEIPMEWLKTVVLLTAVAVIAFQAYTIGQQQLALQMLQTDVQLHIQSLNGQCQQALERQGFEVTKKPPPVVEEQPEEGKDDAER
jgi:hypothetical protein